MAKLPTAQLLQPTGIYYLARRVAKIVSVDARLAAQDRGVASCVRLWNVGRTAQKQECNGEVRRVMLLSPATDRHKHLERLRPVEHPSSVSFSAPCLLRPRCCMQSPDPAAQRVARRFRTTSGESRVLGLNLDICRQSMMFTHYM